MNILYKITLYSQLLTIKYFPYAFDVYMHYELFIIEIVHYVSRYTHTRPVCKGYKMSLVHVHVQYK